MMLRAAIWHFRLAQPASLTYTISPSKALYIRPCRKFQRTQVCNFTEQQSSGQEQQLEHISSTANSYVKHCAKLRTDRAYRQQHGSVIVSGLVPLCELAQDIPGLRVQVLIQMDQGSIIPALLRPMRTVIVSESVLRKITGLNSVEGLAAAAEMAIPQMASFDTWKHRSLKKLLVLDGVQDPGNLGTLLRTALALGWQGAYVLPGCCDPFNEKALRASRGAAFKLPLEFGSWSRLEQITQQHSLVRLAAEPRDAPAEGSLSGPSAQEDTALQDLPAALENLHVALVLGSEGQGLSPLARKSCTPIAIPIANMESLNVSQAGTILMFLLSNGMPQLLGRVLSL